jgi:regulatory protein
MSYADDEIRKPKRPPPPMTRVRLRQIAEDYVGRFGGPSSNLRRVLKRHIDKAARAHHEEADVTNAWQRDVDAIVLEFLSAGALDDARYAQNAAQSLSQRGVAPRAVAYRLQQKGIAQEDIRGALADLGEPRQVEWQAALHLARRRRLGPYRPSEDRKERRLKDAGVLARAGFSPSVAFKIVDLDPAELDAL